MGASAGSAAGGGFNLQAIVGAYVAAHILARQPLGWLELRAPDTPVSLSAETGGPGDDYRITFQDGTVAEVQVKGGLRGGERLLAAVEALARGLAADPVLHAILVVDERSSHSVRVELHVDLERIAGGREDNLYPVTRRVLARVDQIGVSRAELRRLSVTEVDRRGQGSMHQKQATQLLAGVLEDKGDAASAWSVVAHESLRMIETRGRRDRDRWVRLLGSKGIGVRTDGPAGSVSAALGFTEARAPVAPPAELTATPEAAPAGDALWLPRAEEAMALQLQGASASSIRVAERVLVEMENASASPALRGRLHNIVGAAQLALGRARDAIDSFRRALDYKPGAAVIVANLAQAELVAGRRGDALRHALESIAAEPGSALAWSVRIQASEPPLEEAQIPLEVREHPHVLTARAMVIPDGAEHERQTLLREALRRGPREAQIMVLLAESLYMGLQPRRTADPVPQEVLADLRRLGREAASLLVNSENDTFRARALVMQGAAADLAGSEGDGLPFYEEALQIAPSYYRARFATAKALLERGKPEAAMYHIDTLPVEVRPGWPSALRAAALVRLGRAEEIDRDVQAALAPSEADPGMIANYLGGLITEADRAELAGRVFLALEDSGQRGWAHLFRARFAGRQGDRGAAAREYRCALDSSNTDVAADVRLEFASYLLAEDDPGAVADLFEAAGEAVLCGGAIRLYARALFAIGRLDKVAAILARSAEDGELPAWALDLESRIALHREDIPGATRVLRRLVALQPEDIDARLHLAHVLIRVGARDEAAAVLGPLDERGDLDDEDSVRLAGLLVDAGQSARALQRAYGVLRTAPDDPAQQAACVGVLMRSDRGDFFRDVVVPDTWVKLQGILPPRDTVEFLILARGPVSVQQKEFVANDPRVANLLGLRVGDTVTLREGAVGARTYRVLELKSALLHVSHDAMLNFEDRFPGRKDLQMAHVGEGDAFDPTALVAAVARSTEAGDEALRDYVEKQLPIGVLATDGTNSLRRTYLQLLYDPHIPVSVEEPDRAAISLSSAAARSAGVVLTATALATLRELGLLHLVAQLFNEIHAPQSLVDELTDEIEAWQEAREHGGYVAARIHDGALDTTPVGVDVIDEQIRRVTEVRDFVRANASIKPRPLAPWDAREEEHRRLIGPSSYDAQALAEESIPLYADDLGLRRLARYSREAPSFPTLALLEAAHERGLLTKGELYHAGARLLVFGHTVVPISTGLVLDAIARAGYQVDATVLRIFKGLSDPIVTQESALRVVAAVLRLLALNPVGQGALGAVTMVALDALTGGREARPVATRLHELVGSALAYLPIQRAAVEDRMDAFLRARHAEDL